MMMLVTMFAMNVLAENVKFKVSNMHCQNCANRVEKALKANKAVSEVKVNLECKAVSVSYDAAKTNVEALQKALTDAKFEAKVATSCDKRKVASTKARAVNINAARKRSSRKPASTSVEPEVADTTRNPSKL